MIACATSSKRFSRMPMEEQELLRGLLDAVIVKHQVAAPLPVQQGQRLKGKNKRAAK